MLEPGSAGGTATSTDDERWIRKALDVAREIGRKDLESARRGRARELGDRPARHRAGEPARWRRRSSSPRRAATSATLGWTLVSQARIDSLRGRASTRPRPRSSRRRGAVLAVGQRLAARARQQLARGWVERRRGDLPAAERCFRDAIRILKPVEDRGTLVREPARRSRRCSSRAARSTRPSGYALEARETVGPHDSISRATTRMALGLVRAAQGRDEEAETLLREAIEMLDGTDSGATGASRSTRSSASCANAAARPRRRRTRSELAEPTSRRPRRARARIA